MKRLASWCGIVLLAALLSGCISYPTRTYSPASGKPIQRVQVIAVVPPKSVGIVDYAGAYNSFGLIGAGIGAAIQAARTDAFASEVGSLPARMAQELMSGVIAEMQGGGYQVTVGGNQPRAIDPVEFTFDYGEVRSEVARDSCAVSRTRSLG